MTKARWDIGTASPDSDETVLLLRPQTTSVGTQPTETFYWYNMVMNSLSEYSLVWSLTKRLEEIDFVQ